MYFDTHAHLFYPPLDECEDEVFAQITADRVIHTIEIGTDVEMSRRAIEYARRHPGHYASVGIHPVDAQSLRREDFERDFSEIVSLSETGSDVVRAIGETGFDRYHLGDGDEGVLLDRQWYAFFAHAQLAHTTRTPLVIHTREARDITLRSLALIASDAHYADIPAIILHCYSEDRAFAEECLALFGDRVYFAFGGVITYRSRNEHIIEALKTLPSSQILTETDAPFLTPYLARKNGLKHNDSRTLPEIVDRIALIRGEERDEVMRYTFANAMRIFDKKI